MTSPNAILEPVEEQVAECLERVLASEGFAGSPQLSRFLRYVVEHGVAGDLAALKESVIGTAVFNRGLAYDQKADPIVRVEARRLRARLEAYYQGQGIADPVRILLPKGGYQPVFEQVEAMPAPELPEAPVRQKSRRWMWWTVVAVAIVALLSVQALTRPERAVSRFWSGILGGDRPVLLVPADSALVMLQDLTHQPVSLADYVAGSYRTSSQGEPLSPLTMSLGGRRYTSIADLEFAAALAHRPEAAKRGVATRYARDVRLEDLKANNIVLLGARHSNPWVELFEKDATFLLEHDETNGTFRIVNRAPQAGEQAEIVIPAGQLPKQIYGIVTFHRAAQGGSAAIVVAGTTVAGTEAAGDFLLDDNRMLPLLRQAEAGGEVKGFDVLLRGQNLDGSAPHAEVVAFHVQR